ncbi:MAG: DUF465 domain-containing protein [Pseudomonadota bacterium]
MSNNIENFSEEALRQKIQQLRIKHRELDSEIINLEHSPFVCHLTIRKLKKGKLKIKETLSKLESALIPNLNA